VIASIALSKDPKIRALENPFKSGVVLPPQTQCSCASDSCISKLYFPKRPGNSSLTSELPTNREWPYCGLHFSGLPIASRKMALLSFACGEKNAITSSSKKVSPVAPRCWAYAAR